MYAILNDNARSSHAASGSRGEIQETGEAFGRGPFPRNIETERDESRRFS